MKLYEAPKGIRIVEKLSDDSEYLTFDHIDGMYSYCTTEKGGVIHLSASTPIEPYSGKEDKFMGYYQISTNK